MNSRVPFRMLTALIAGAVLSTATSQEGNGLLLPFPAEAAAESQELLDDAPVPERHNAGSGMNTSVDLQRAQELAETFIRRQQMETANSVPRRGAKILRVPARTAGGTPAGVSPIATGTSPIAAAAPVEPQTLETAGYGSGGPSSELLPLPGDDATGLPPEMILPEVSGALPAGDFNPDSVLPDSANDGEVPRTDLAPAPAYGGVEDQARTGPVFRISGAQAFAVARARGFKFTPAGGIGLRDGAHTAASQFPNTLTSEVHGVRMSQLRPPPSWSVTETSNTFFMFCDANYNAVRLAPGWRIRGIKLAGPHWRWVACPRSGANTASFSIRVHAYKGQDAATRVELTGLTLEGPEGVTDWRDAFPWINGRAPARRNAPGPAIPAELPAPEALAAAPDQNGEPALPQ
jgi:hypothetical protein